MYSEQVLSSYVIKSLRFLVNQNNLQLRDLGVEKSYITTSGNEICTPAPFEGSIKRNRKFKILTSALIALGYVD